MNKYPSTCFQMMMAVMGIVCFIFLIFPNPIEPRKTPPQERIPTRRMKIKYVERQQNWFVNLEEDIYQVLVITENNKEYIVGIYLDENLFPIGDDVNKKQKRIKVDVSSGLNIEMKVTEDMNKLFINTKISEKIWKAWNEQKVWARNGPGEVFPAQSSKAPNRWRWFSRFASPANKNNPSVQV
ncbi:uncharacterized protein LOC117169368 [Belonocnema kinseyi]|uniref:uncharacterized protein LOC117169368 n=1 Tax=Belonocnema kinseyi TaxID=2817044 RepID=UPI00143DF5B3|nr:uncharacterized protein LOC117169368 [Belonocnema kinseyi]